MTASNLISTYMAYGLAADRPSSPSVGSGNISLYFATDTGDLSFWTGAAWATYSGGSSVEHPFHPGFASGRYYPPNNVQAIGTHSTVTGTLYYSPFYVGAQTTFTKIGCRTGTVSGTQKATMGAYANSVGAPTGAALVAAEATLSSNSQNDATISQTLNPGWYWLAITVDSTVTLESTGSTSDAHMLGMSTTNTLAFGLNESYTYSSGVLPTAGTNSISLDTSAHPICYLKP